MLIGRSEERARIASMLDDARNDRSSVLILRGEAGIGKTALLDDAAERAEGFLVLRTVGVEAEAEIAFASLQQFLGPIVHLAERLPPRQANALRTALAIEVGEAPERLAVAVATLVLFVMASESSPLLGIADDAHWLDRASADVLTFVGRRLGAERIVLLFGIRDPGPRTFPVSGIDDLRLRSMPEPEAIELLASQGTRMAVATAKQLVALTGGNPLALREQVRALDERQLAGTAPLDEPLRVDADTEHVFRERIGRLPARLRRTLLALASCGPEDATPLERAVATIWDPDEPVLAAAEEAGLLELGHLRFAHPLARSAVYQAATEAERRSAHAALAVVTDQPDRRAWHLALAAEGPDEEVAASLESTAETFRQRGGAAAQARALERAAALSPEPAARGRRCFEAALAAERAGWLSRAESLLSEVAGSSPDAGLKARATARLSYLLFDRGEFEHAYGLAVDAADRATGADAVHLLTASGAIHVLHHSLRIADAVAMAERADRLAAGDPDPHVTQMLAWVWLLSGRTREAASILLPLVADDQLDPVLAVDVGSTLLYLEDHHRARLTLERSVGRMRASFASGILSYALSQLAKLEVRSGNLARAYELELESQELTEPLEKDVALADNLACLGSMEAMLGQKEGPRHASAGLAVAERHGDLWNAIRARAALGLDALAHGDPASAVTWLEPAAEMLERGGVANPNVFRVDADLIETLVRLGRLADAERHFARLESQASASSWGRVAVARCRGLVAPEEEFEVAFDDAVRVLDGEPSPFERGRTELCYGERLRRAGHRKAARERLARAQRALEATGARPWAERAVQELEATGQRLRPRGHTGGEDLTPRESQIATLVAEGLSNRDIGSRLFLSEKTVEFHLSRIYRKLDLGSRTALVRRMLEGSGPSSSRV